jgi:hypothetical protein
MNMLSILWKLTSRQQRAQLLSFMTQYQQQLFKKVVTGKLKYCPAFDEKKCIFVHIPKTAGISVCKALLSVDAIGHMPLYYYQVALGQKQYSEYYKFSFVRNPWDRVYSAYRYLAKGGLSDQDKIWSEAFKKYSSFDDFVRKWVDEENIQLSLHFMPQSHFIKNAQGVIDLNYLGRFENLERDYEVIRKTLGGDAIGENNASGSGLSYAEAYSKKSRDIVARVYRDDINLLGYDFDSFATQENLLQ